MHIRMQTSEFKKSNANKPTACFENVGVVTPPENITSDKQSRFTAKTGTSFSNV